MTYQKNNFYCRKKTQRGFIALISTLILTIVLMSLVINAGTSSFFARFDAAGSENMAISQELSKACARLALLRIAQDYDYLGNESIEIEKNKHCLISDIIYNQKDANTPMIDKKIATIFTSAQYPMSNGSWSTNKLVVTIFNPAAPRSPSDQLITIDSWE